VTSLDHDDVVLAPASVALPTLAYDVERFPFADPREDGTLEPEKTFVLPDATPLQGIALELDPIDPAGTPLEVVHGAAWSGNVATVAPPDATAFPQGLQTSAGPIPGQLVLVDDGSGTPKRALVKELRLTATLDRAPQVGTTPLECVVLATEGFRYEADQAGPLTVVVLPSARTPSGAATVDMPRLHAGELVEAADAVEPGAEPGVERREERGVGDVGPRRAEPADESDALLELARRVRPRQRAKPAASDCLE
jgi:hypothetical protein